MCGTVTPGEDDVTHITGPRKRVVARLAACVLREIVASKASVSEAFEALHEVQMDFLRRLLAPFEKDCPTCPKRGRKRRASRRCGAARPGARGRGGVK